VLELAEALDAVMRWDVTFEGIGMLNGLFGPYGTQLAGGNSPMAQGWRPQGELVVVPKLGYTDAFEVAVNEQLDPVPEHAPLQLLNV
jgi:hypothetical protein